MELAGGREGRKQVADAEEDAVYAKIWFGWFGGGRRISHGNDDDAECVPDPWRGSPV